MGEDAPMAAVPSPTTRSPAAIGDVTTGVDENTQEADLDRDVPMEIEMEQTGTISSQPNIENTDSQQVKDTASGGGPSTEDKQPNTATHTNVEDDDTVEILEIRKKRPEVIQLGSSPVPDFKAVEGGLVFLSLPLARHIDTLFLFWKFQACAFANTGWVYYEGRRFRQDYKSQQTS